MRPRALLTVLTLAVACGGGQEAVGVDAGLDAARQGDAEAAVDSSHPCPVADADGDGVASYSCGGDDCDDSDPETYPGAADPNGWTITVVEEDATGPAVAVAPDGLVHVVYSTVDALRHATDAAAWEGDTIDAIGATGASIVAGGDGSVHVAYVAMEVDGPSLKYAIGGADGWTVESVATGVEWARVAALALGSDGQVHVAYEGRDDDGTVAVLHAMRGAAGWETETVWRIRVAGSRPSLAVTSDDEVHIAAIDVGRDDLLHLQRVGKEWTSELIDNEAWSGPPAIVATAQGLNVAYDAGELRFATWTDAFWRREDMLVGGTAPALALDASDEAHVAFVREDSVFKGSVVTVRYATRTGDAWTDEEIDRVDAAAVSIAVDPDGRPHVAYTRQAVLHAVRQSAPDALDQDCDGHDG